MPTQSKKWSVYRAASAILGVATALWLVAYCAALGFSSQTHAAGGESRLALTAMEETTRLHGSRDSLRDQLERLSEREIKLFYTRCSQEGIGRRLDGSEAMACSVGYDILLKKHFAGDFEQFLLWSRLERAAVR